MLLNSLDRYFVQSSVRTPANLSRPNRIGATVKATRSIRKACTAGPPRTAVRAGGGGGGGRGGCSSPPWRPRAAVSLRALDQLACALEVLVAPVREHADRRS